MDRPIERDIIEEASISYEAEKEEHEKDLGDVERIDEVYGKLDANSPNYVNLGWIRTSVLMAKTQIGLGVLSIPYVLETIGLIPGLLVILVIAAITTWSDYVIGTFKLNHRNVHSVADVGQLFFGPVGRECFGAIYWLYMTCIAGSGMLGISIALNSVSNHGACTVVFVVVAAIATFLFSVIQTLDKLSFLGWIGLVSIMAAILTLVIAVTVTRPSLAPAVGEWSTDLKLFANPTFAEAANAMATVVFAFGGTPAFFTVISEMRDPKTYTKSMLTCQGFVTAVYVVVGLVVYSYAGQYVASPALGTAGDLLKKICYGIAIPGLLVGCILYSHLPAKYIFVRLLRGSRHLGNNTLLHYVLWTASVGFCVAFSFVIASAVPFFNGLIGLIGALFGTFLSMQIMAGMWLYDNWQLRTTDKSIKYRLLVAWNFFIIIAGSFLCIGGTYGSILGIIGDFAEGNVSSPFNCADNSG